ncbi:hypothetical protein CPB85DRAFT_1436031 [Mucidula mucida]|nr:hypothetical protein CPB85DRAFT_1436031 [Mucidula mucida]
MTWAFCLGIEAVGVLGSGVGADNLVGDDVVLGDSLSGVVGTKLSGELSASFPDLRHLKAWVFLILGLPEGLRGVDIDFCLGLFTTIYILRLLVPHTENIFNKLDVYVTRAILAHEDAVKALAHTQLNGFPSPEDINYGGPSRYYSRYMVYRYKVIDLDDNDATVPPPTEAFISFLHNTEAPLVVQFEEFARIIVLVLQDICTEHWQSRSQVPTPKINSPAPEHNRTSKSNLYADPDSDVSSQSLPDISPAENDGNGFWMDVYDYEETEDFSLVSKKVGQRHILKWGMFIAFHPLVHQRLAEHEELSSFMCELKRGDQFKYFTGKHSGMAATGACRPKGGAPGNTYNYYVDFEVESLAGLHRAFDYAEWASRELCKYSFCEPQLGYFWQTRPNVTWSFNSADMHGTMLPGVNPEFPPPEEFINSMRTPALHILARSQPENAALACDRDNQPGWPMQQYLTQQCQNRPQQQAPNQAAGGPAIGPPAGRVGTRGGVRVPGWVSTGNHVCVPRQNARAARRAKRAVRTRDANFVYWDNRGAGH